MRLQITHKTTYRYDQPVAYALQQLRLLPRSGHGQTVVNWQSQVQGGTTQLSFDDQFVNHVELILVDAGASEIEIVSQGVVETVDRQGVVGAHHGFAPLWLFQEPTEVTRPGVELRRLARAVAGGGAQVDPLGLMHRLSAAIGERVSYETGTTHAATTAEEALVEGRGVCQDHAHVMISAARAMGFPARYVSGYLLMDESDQQEASHAWCEVWLDPLGWVGFDVSNGISPDARYVRVATGRDYTDAAPVRGLRMGQGGEDLHVALQVRLQPAQ